MYVLLVVHKQGFDSVVAVALGDDFPDSRIYSQKQPRFVVSPIEFISYHSLFVFYTFLPSNCESKMSEDSAQRLQNDLNVVMEKVHLCREIMLVSPGIQQDETLAGVVGFLEACRDRYIDMFWRISSFARSDFIFVMFFLL